MNKRIGWPRYKVAEKDSPFRRRRRSDRDADDVFRGMLYHMGDRALEALREALESPPWERKEVEIKRETVH